MISRILELFAHFPEHSCADSARASRVFVILQYVPWTGKSLSTSPTYVRLLTVPLSVLDATSIRLDSVVVALTLHPPALEHAYRYQFRRWSRSKLCPCFVMVTT